MDQYQGPVIPPDSLTHIQRLESYEEQLTAIIPYNWFASYRGIDMSAAQAKANIQTILGAWDLNYIHKKRLLTQFFDSLITEFGRVDNELAAAKNKIGINGFFPLELETIVWTDNPVSIQRSVLALESIKFSTALQVFGLMDTFLQQFGRVYGIDRTRLTNFIDLYTKRADIDVLNFLQSCYLNPFEDPRTCSVIDDFNQYFVSYEPNTEIDQKLYKELMIFIDTRLDDSAFPSLIISFDRFDPQAQQLGFKIGINTLAEDEKALINQGILNPHIFILSRMINLLKASKFIMGNAIAINDMRIERNELEVWWKPLVVNSSTRNFMAPLQRNTEREIFDTEGTNRLEVIEAFETIQQLEDRQPESFSDTVNINLDDFGTTNESRNQWNIREIGAGTWSAITESVQITTGTTWWTWQIMSPMQWSAPTTGNTPPASPPTQIPATGAQSWSGS